MHSFHAPLCFFNKHQILHQSTTKENGSLLFSIPSCQDYCNCPLCSVYAPYCISTPDKTACPSISVPLALFASKVPYDNASPQWSHSLPFYTALCHVRYMHGIELKE